MAEVGKRSEVAAKATKKPAPKKVSAKTMPKPVHHKSKSAKATAPKKPKSVTVKKKATKKRAPAKPKFTQKDFEQYFYSLELADFIQYTKIWNETALKIKIPNHDDYDKWLNYFKTLSPNIIKQLAISGMDILPTEGYAALSRWHDIIKSPHRIDKIHQAGLTNNPVKGHVSIIALARKNDRMGVLMAVRDQLAEKLEKGAGARDMASLAREMGDVLDQIADLEKRAGPKKGTKAAQLLHDFDVKNRRPAANGGGSRNTSFRSRVTIDDMEGK